jgi:hypothetical protein
LRCGPVLAAGIQVAQIAKGAEQVRREPFLKMMGALTKYGSINTRDSLAHGEEFEPHGFIFHEQKDDRPLKVFDTWAVLLR